jgi:nicotinamide riboside kinase
VKTEFERAYVFSHENIPKILSFLGAQTATFPKIIQDYYLNENLRIRLITSDHHDIEEIQLTRKNGDKKSGQRIEKEHNIDKETANILISDSKLQIIKKRYHIINTIGNSKCSRLTLDIIEAPMKLVILEIESTNGEMPPTAKEVFGTELHECQLSTWNLFHQKIGICGAPSSGKTETAKSISHLLNTHFHANSFHVLEYATSFIQKYDRHPNAMDQFMLWYSQRAREENAATKANIVISDSPTFLSYIYMMYYQRKPMDNQFKIYLAKLYKRILEDIDRYNKIIYLRPKNLTENNVRFQNQEEIHEIARRIHSFLECHNIPHIVTECGNASKILRELFCINQIKEV